MGDPTPTTTATPTTDPNDADPTPILATPPSALKENADLCRPAVRAVTPVRAQSLAKLSECLHSFFAMRLGRKDLLALHEHKDDPKGSGEPVLVIHAFVKCGPVLSEIGRKLKDCIELLEHSARVSHAMSAKYSDNDIGRLSRRPQSCIVNFRLLDACLGDTMVDCKEIDRQSVIFVKVVWRRLTHLARALHPRLMAI